MIFFPFFWIKSIFTHTHTHTHTYMQILASRHCGRVYWSFAIFSTYCDRILYFQQLHILFQIQLNVKFKIIFYKISLRYEFTRKQKTCFCLIETSYSIINTVITGRVGRRTDRTPDFLNIATGVHNCNKKFM